MPYKSESIRLQGLQDRRRKLTDGQKEQIRELYAAGGTSLKELSGKFDVSKKTILLTVNQESASKAKEYQKENWRRFQQSKEDHARSVRECRRYKQSLYLSGQLVFEKE